MTEEELQLKAERRARREARRAKQRILNITRAKEMHAARLEHERTTSVTKKPVVPPSKAHVGCSGWYYWHWRGGFYPADLPGPKWFPHYTTQFRTVELNAPFYAWPSTKTIQTWLRQAAGADNFVYTVKVSELITHVKRFVGTKTLVQDFSFIADLLGERMGCFLYQLPPSHRYTPARLRAITTQLAPLRRHRNVVEFRHASWWNEDVYAAFRASGITFCSSSGPRMPDELVTTSDDVYLRFHGTKQWYRHDYSNDELKVWAARVRAAKPRHVWAYFNNDRDGNAPRNARIFERLLTRRTLPAL